MSSRPCASLLPCCIFAAPDSTIIFQKYNTNLKRHKKTPKLNLNVPNAGAGAGRKEDEAPEPVQSREARKQRKARKAGLAAEAWPGAARFPLSVTDGTGESGATPGPVHKGPPQQRQ